MDKLRQIFSPSTKINKIPLSYINRLFPEFQESPYFVLYKKEQHGNDTNYVNTVEELEQAPNNELDLTGSPLKYSFGEENFEDTIIVEKRHWLKEEEEYLPFSKSKACNFLNICIEHLNTAPIFALCDGDDTGKTRLLGVVAVGEWFTRIEVKSLGIESLDTLETLCGIALREHVELSRVPEHEVSISSFTVFELHGTREEMFNWKEISKSSFEGYIGIEVTSSNFSIDPPSRASKIDIVVQILSGSVLSPLRDLWNQLRLLEQYLSILEAYKNAMDSKFHSAPLQFPDNFDTPYAENYENILENLLLLLNGDYSYRNTIDSDLERTSFIDEDTVECGEKMEKLVENLRMRSNQDFTDLLWEQLIMNTNYTEMVKCIHSIFEEVLSHGSVTQVNFTETTKFGKILSSLKSQNIISHLLAGSLPLEYLIDMGITKLSRDYMYILMKAGLLNSHVIREKLSTPFSEEFKIADYRKTLLCMIQIHACLEFVTLSQNNLECSTESLSELFLYAFEKFVCDESPVNNCSVLYGSSIYNLTAPLPSSMTIDLRKKSPNIRRVSLSSQAKFSRLITTRYYSRLPIFPTNIYPTEESNTSDIMYRVIGVTSRSNKVK